MASQEQLGLGLRTSNRAVAWDCDLFAVSLFLLYFLIFFLLDIFIFPRCLYPIL